MNFTVVVLFLVAFVGAAAAAAVAEPSSSLCPGGAITSCPPSGKLTIENATLGACTIALKSDANCRAVSIYNCDVTHLDFTSLYGVGILLLQDIRCSTKTALDDNGNAGCVNFGGPVNGTSILIDNVSQQFSSSSFDTGVHKIMRFTVVRFGSALKHAKHISLQHISAQHSFVSSYSHVHFWVVSFEGSIVTSEKSSAPLLSISDCDMSNTRVATPGSENFISESDVRLVSFTGAISGINIAISGSTLNNVTSWSCGGAARASLVYFGDTVQSAKVEILGGSCLESVAEACKSDFSSAEMSIARFDATVTVNTLRVEHHAVDGAAVISPVSGRCVGVFFEKDAALVTSGQSPSITISNVSLGGEKVVLPLQQSNNAPWYGVAVAVLPVVKCGVGGGGGSIIRASNNRIAFLSVGGTAHLTSATIFVYVLWLGSSGGSTTSATVTHVKEIHCNNNHLAGGNYHAWQAGVAAGFLRLQTPLSQIQVLSAVNNTAAVSLTVVSGAASGDPAQLWNIFAILDVTASSSSMGNSLLDVSGCSLMSQLVAKSDWACGGMLSVANGYSVSGFKTVLTTDVVVNLVIHEPKEMARATSLPGSGSLFVQCGPKTTTTTSTSTSTTVTETSTTSSSAVTSTTTLPTTTVSTETTTTTTTTTTSQPSAPSSKSPPTTTTPEASHTGGDSTGGGGDSDAGKSDNTTAIIVGACVGGGVLLSALAIFILIVLRKKRQAAAAAAQLAELPGEQQQTQSLLSVHIGGGGGNVNYDTAAAAANSPPAASTASTAAQPAPAPASSLAAALKPAPRSFVDHTPDHNEANFAAPFLPLKVPVSQAATAASSAIAAYSDFLAEQKVDNAAPLLAAAEDAAKRLHGGVGQQRGQTLDEVGALVCYSCDVQSIGAARERNFYFVLNKALRERQAAAIAGSSSLRDLYVWLLRGLSKIPAEPAGSVTFRGMDRPLTQLSKAYRTPKAEICFPAFTSTTTDSAVMSAFSSSSGSAIPGAAASSSSAAAVGTLIRITTLSARRIDEYSLFQGEREVLLPPNTMVRLEAALDSTSASAIASLPGVTIPKNVDFVVLAQQPTPAHADLMQ